MLRRTYPLAGALELREGVRDRSAEDVVRATEALAWARETWRSAESALLVHREAAPARGAAGRGASVASAAELAREERFAEACALEEAGLVERLERARRAVLEAERDLAEARRALSEAAVDVEVVERHRERWQREVRLEVERDEELEAEDHRRRRP
jgi:hypothetical protein